MITLRDQEFDVIVIGLGAAGSAAVYHLAKRGKKVLGLDRFTPPHNHGSSHGQTRILREAYFEHPAYVPLVRRAYELWAELEKESARSLFRQTGGLMLGLPESSIVSGSLRSAQAHHLTHELLSADALRGRFPALAPSENMAGVWEPRAGVLFPEICVEAHLRLARRHGAVLRFNEPLLRWKEAPDAIEVTTASQSWRGAQALFTTGSWTQSLFPELSLGLTVERQAAHWFKPVNNSNSFGPGQSPVHIWEYEPGRFFYGIPDFGSGVKLALHHQGEPAAPDQARRDVDDLDRSRIAGLARRYLPDLGERIVSSEVCLYTNTDDGHFLIDFHPFCPRLLLASPCSGHGFKYSSAIGEVVADLLERGKSRFDLTLHRRRQPPLAKSV